MLTQKFLDNAKGREKDTEEGSVEERGNWATKGRGTLKTGEAWRSEAWKREKRGGARQHKQHKQHINSPDLLSQTNTEKITMVKDSIN